MLNLAGYELYCFFFQKNYFRPSLPLSSIFLVLNLFSLCIFYLVGRAKSHFCSINVVSVWCIFEFKWIWFIQNDLWDGGQFSTLRFNCSKGKNIFKDEIDWLVDLVSLILKQIILSIRNKNVSICSCLKTESIMKGVIYALWPSLIVLY